VKKLYNLKYRDMENNRQLAVIPAVEDERVKRWRLIKRVQKENNYPRLEVLVKLVKKEDEEITRKQVQDFLDMDISTQVTKEQKAKNTEGHLVSYSPNDWWQFDIFDLTRYEKKNDGYKYLLACVDVFTRKAYVEPMKEKNAQACTEALKTVLDRSGVKPKAMFSDIDGAFVKQPFPKFAKDNQITLNTNAHSDHRALGIIDNFAKRIKQTLTRRFGDQGSVKWTPIIQEVVSNYNKMDAQALDGIAPNEATEEKNQSKILVQNIEKNSFNKANIDVQQGDRARKSIKGDLTKGTDPIWSDAIFEVAEVDGNTVTLGDGTKYKRTDLLIVPKGTKYGGINPVNAQLRENKLEREKLKEAKELAYREKQGPRPQPPRAPPRIRIEPVPPPPLAIEDKPKAKAAMSALISQQKANYLAAKTREQRKADRERLEAAGRAAKKTEAERAARVRKEIADEVKKEKARINKETRQLFKR
jgi:hypothetical protein